MGESDVRRWRLPRICLYAAIFGVGLAAGLFIDQLRHAVGKMEYQSRYSVLVNVKTMLLAQAEKDGRFPATIDGAISQLGFNEHVRADELVYMAGNMSYEPNRLTTAIFAEKNPREYGFIRGRFMFTQGDWEFWLEY